MSLPRKAVPIYTEALPSNKKKKVSFRPFLVHEEKILLLAQETGNEMDIFRAIVTMVKSCIQSKDINVSTMPIFDFHWLYLMIRAKAVSEVIEVNAACEKCGHYNEVDLPVADIKPPQPLPEDAFKITVDNPDTVGPDDLLGLKMRYPTVEMLEKHENIDPKNIEAIYRLIIDCIESAFTKTQMFDPRQEPVEEQNKWIESLDANTFEKIRDFTTKLPALHHTLIFDCKKCQHHNERGLHGPSDFF